MDPVIGFAYCIVSLTAYCVYNSVRISRLAAQCAECRTTRVDVAHDLGIRHGAGAVVSRADGGEDRV